LFLIDSHCHLDFEVFNDDRQQVLKRAAQVGVECIIIPGVTPANSQSALQLARSNPRLYAAVGVHPNEAGDWTDLTIQTFRTLAQDARVVAIGEIGLDYYRDRTPKPIQRQIFEAQLNLADELELPIIIHSRQALNDMLGILRTWLDGLRLKGSRLIEHPGVLHAFEGDIQSASEAIRLGFLLGVAGPVTYQNAAQKQALFSQLPLESLLIETDAPYLTPHPHRGKRNEPAYVRLVAEKIAQLQRIPLESVAETTSTNAVRVFWKIKVGNT
jgi:TatD DNase family protein